MTGFILVPDAPARTCIVLDLSRDGAGLMSLSRDPIPDAFDLAFPDSAEVLPVRLAWQREGRAGVAFLSRRQGPPVLPEPTSADT